VVGFGRTSIGDPTVPDDLQSINVTYNGNDDCDRDNYPLQVKSDMFCAGSSQGGRDSCTGDPGSPLCIKIAFTERTSN
jgi:trypsin